MRHTTVPTRLPTAFCGLVLLTDLTSCTAEDELEPFSDLIDDTGFRQATAATDEPLPQSVLDDIDATLPEGQDATVARPELFPAGFDPNPHVVSADTDVWVTFVQEGASYHSAMGYFTYPTGNPPASLTQQQLEDGLIFADASGTGPGLAGGGSLYNGVRMSLGTFQPGVQIGFYLVRNGACDDPGVGTCSSLGVDFTHPIYTTVDAMNPEYATDPDLARHVVMADLLGDPASDSQLLAFEDQDRLGGPDDDFNDVVFRVTASPALDDGGPTIPSTTCGNGIIEGNEQCDDGNAENGDGCSSSCQDEGPTVCGMSTHLWLRADDPALGAADGDPIATWPDASGNGNDAIQGNGALRPTFVADGIGGEPTLRFDDEQMLGLTGDEVMDTMSVFSVYALQGDRGDAGHYPVAFGNGTNVTGQYIGIETLNAHSGSSSDLLDVIGGFDRDVRGTSQGVSELGRASLVSWQTVGNMHSTDIRIDGESAASTPVGPDVAVSVSLGNASGTGMGGVGGLPALGGHRADADVSEIIVFDRELTLDQRSCVEEYLNLKYEVYEECGNGVVAAQEECDDGNTDDYDGCSSSCTDEGELCGLDAHLWLRADDPSLGAVEGDLVATWPDTSGNGFDAIQGNPAAQPVFVVNGIGGQPVLHFDGGDVLGLTGSTVMNAMNVFAVYALRGDGGGSGHYPVCFGNGTNSPGQYIGIETLNWASGNSSDLLDIFGGYGHDMRADYTDVSALDQPHLVAWQTVGNMHSTEVRIDGSVATTYPSGPDAGLSVTLGNASGTGTGGIGGLPAFGGHQAIVDVAEVIVIDSELTAGARACIDNMLVTKYGL